MKSTTLFQPHLISSFLISLLVISPSYANQRLALVIGNSNYSDAPLANPVNDAKAITQKLKNLGFSVDFQNNVNRKALRKAIRTFGQQLGNEDVGLFYYAGHGMQVNGENYLIPIGSDIITEDEVPDEAVSVNAVLRKMESAKNAVNIVILDACRNNPFKSSFRSGNRGLRRVDGPVGSIIIYATAPGDVADDGKGTNGVFTSHLLQHIETPGLTIHQIMNRVRNGVRQSTNGKQIPWESSALTGDFYFISTKPVALADDTETIFWQVVKQENSQPFYQKYIDHYPQGIYRQQAIAFIQRLLGADTGRELVEKADYLYFDKSDRTTAFKLYQQAAQQGSVSAMASLAKMWAMGQATGVGKDMQKARHWRNKAFTSINQLAENGHIFSQYQLGTLYKLVDNKYQLAIYWYRKAADQGNSSAQVNLGNMYRFGEGVEQSDRDAVAWYRKAANQGNITVQNNLGTMYQYGKGVEQSDRDAVAWYRKAANQGNTTAQNNLGIMYQYGKGVEKSDREAVTWYRKAADQGNIDAQINLAFMYQNGKGIEQSDREAVTWYRKAADQGNIDAQINLAYMYKNGKGVEQSDREVVAWYRKAADQGNANAQDNLGYLYREGKGVEQNDREAVAWYRKAADQGNIDAQVNLAFMYQNGKGIEQSDREAVTWYRKAADQGNVGAQASLGYMYQLGKGIRQSDKKAVTWYHKAADQGNRSAQVNLAFMYQNGKGVEQSDKEAVMWYRKAAKQGSKNAQSSLTRLGKDW